MCFSVIQVFIIVMVMISDLKNPKLGSISTILYSVSKVLIHHYTLMTNDTNEIVHSERYRYSNNNTVYSMMVNGMLRYHHLVAGCNSVLLLPLQVTEAPSSVCDRGNWLQVGALIRAVGQHGSPSGCGHK
ncbi:hypothetical protein J4Q44_G00092570 [Coregonus suidteri]|uniref:Secreted protein n=1 Tax=Coregonus suidteri TaxID=861788 RepID=A0AAN8QXA9_9TELE